RSCVRPQSTTRRLCPLIGRWRSEGASMPRRLIDRCQPDSIREFRASARQRYEDGLALAGAGNRTAAIYLWGYVAEMTLKAAYFSLFGLAEHDAITVPGHIQPA